MRPSPRRHVMRGTIVLVFAACACAPLFLPNYPLFVLSLAIVNTIAVLGVNVVMGHAGQISLGQAGFSAIGAYATALLAVNLDVSYWLAVPLGALLAAVSGYILGLPALRLGPLYVSMVTFGFGLIVVIIVQNWYELANGPNGMVVPPPYFLGESCFLENSTSPSSRSRPYCFCLRETSSTRSTVVRSSPFAKANWPPAAWA